MSLLCKELDHRCGGYLKLIDGARQTEIFPQRATLVFGAEEAAMLENRDNVLDEIVETAR